MDPKDVLSKIGEELEEETIRYEDLAKTYSYKLRPKIKLLHEDSKIPQTMSDEAAGYDIYAYTEHKSISIKPGECKLIGTGVAITPPENYCAFIMARSGLATKQGLRPANCIGLCDYDYTGEYKVALYNDSNKVQIINHGDRIAQLVFMPYTTPEFIVVDDLEETDRADGGFNSTGSR